MRIPTNSDLERTITQKDLGCSPQADRVPTTEAVEGRLEISSSSCLKNQKWDAFLESVPGGEYQQSARWAAVKQQEGWKVERLLLAESGSILGGVQILWKGSKFGRIGYANRGPLFPSGDHEAHDLLINGLAEIAKSLRLRVLIIHCTETERGVVQGLSEAGFLPNRLRKIVTASWVTPVSRGIERVQAEMRPKTRANLRKAYRKGVRVHNGCRGDLGLFFELMLKTCRRQGVRPNPSSVGTLEVVWDAFEGGGRIRLGIATFEGRPISAALSLRFGRTVNIWKKGSDPEFLNLNPMEPVYFDALDWAFRKGAAICDYGSLQRHTAATLLSGKPLSDEMKRSRDFYNMRFGGHAVLYPEARIYFPDTLWRTAYRMTACSAAGSWLLRRWYQC